MNNNNATFRIQSFSLTDKGRRPNNEDFVALFEPSDTQERKASGCIYIVADGVGGAEIGERASKYAAEKVVYEYLKHPEIEPGKRLKQIMSQVNRDIFNYADGKDIRMATTMSVAVVFNNSLIAANVGDSRVYLIRDKDIRQVTRDHSLVGELVRGGSMTEAEAMKSKMKNRITRSIGGNEDVRVDVFDPIPLQPDDRIILCTDGLTRYAMKKDFLQMALTGTAKQITTDLVAFAKKKGHGGADNITVITVIYEPSTNLETMAQHLSRPIKPEPWEVMQTDLGLKSKKTLDFKSWAFWSLLILGAFAVLAMMIIYILGYFPSPVSTPINTATVPSTTVIVEPAFTQGTPTMQITQDNQPPTSLPPVLGKINSQSASADVYDHPSMDTNYAKLLAVILPEDDIVLTGVYYTGSRGWYLIGFSTATSGEQFGWVLADEVEVTQGDIVTLPTLDYNGDVITPSPVPLSTATPEPVMSCVYTITSGDLLENIASRFGIGGDNYLQITCADSSADKCDLSNPLNIQPGWRIIISGVNGGICTQNGGQPQ